MSRQHMERQVKRIGGWALLVVGIALGVVACEWQSFDADKGEARPVRQLARTSQALIGGKPDRSLTAVGGLARSTSGGTFCTATLIARRVVLTAAHCISSGTRKTNGSPYFRMEIPDATSSQGYRFVYRPSQETSTHSRWSGNVSAGYDVAIVVLKDKVDAALATPIPYNRQAFDNSYVGKDLWFLGYGAIARGWTYPRVKHGATIPIQSVRSDRLIHQAQGKSICFGDSGGPALYQFNGQWRVVGVNSYVTGSCFGTGASMRTDAFQPFIESYLKKYGEGRACASDQDCDPCYVCNAQTKVCEQGSVQKNPKACKPCRSNADCNGGSCQSMGGAFRCVQPCTANRCCPSGEQCDGSGATPLCLPATKICPPALCQQDSDCGTGERCGAGVCGKACTSASDCPSGMLCMSGACRQPQPRKVGESCDNNLPCESGLRCYTIGGKKICSRACSSSSIGNGSPGSACRSDDSCGFDSQCIPLRGSSGNICLKRCSSTSDCLLGMTCTSIRGSSDYCFCQNDSECKQNEVCNKAVLGDYGACAPKTSTCDAGFACQDIGRGVTVCVKQTAPNDPCGNGTCDSSETCSTCPQDCSCPVGQICKNGACQPSNRCGNNVCEAAQSENCSTCPKDCPCAAGESCQSGVCKPTQLCGNGTCEASRGETCSSCVQDCACASGQLCRNGQCVAASNCGNQQCESLYGENCSTCPSDCGCPLTHNCFGGACIPVNPCGNGTCDVGEGENCEQCPVDCGCPSGKLCEKGQCVSQSGCQSDRDCPNGFRCVAGQCLPPTPGGATEPSPPEREPPSLPEPDAGPRDLSSSEPPPADRSPEKRTSPPAERASSSEQETPPVTNKVGYENGPCRPDGSCDLGLQCAATLNQTRTCLRIPLGRDNLPCPFRKRVVQCSEASQQCRMICIQVSAAGCATVAPAPANDPLWLLWLGALLVLFGTGRRQRGAARRLLWNRGRWAKA